MAVPLFIDAVCPLCDEHVTLSSASTLISHMKSKHDMHLKSRKMGCTRPAELEFAMVKTREAAKVIHIGCPSCWFHCPRTQTAALKEHILINHGSEDASEEPVSQPVSTCKTWGKQSPKNLLNDADDYLVVCSNDQPATSDQQGCFYSYNTEQNAVNQHQEYLYPYGNNTMVESYLGALKDETIMFKDETIMFKDDLQVQQGNLTEKAKEFFDGVEELIGSFRKLFTGPRTTA